MPGALKPPRFKLIALDLDGTALDEAGEIRPRTKTAVAAARAAGVEIVLVTGRHHVATRPYHAELALTTPAICCNGAYVFDMARDQAVAGRPIEPAQARELLALCRAHDLHALIYTDRAMTFERMNAHMRRLTEWAARYPEPSRPRIEQVESFDQVIEDAGLIWKFVVSHDDAETLALWRAEVDARSDFSVEFSWTNRADVVRAGLSKGARLIEWARSRGVEASQIVAFGDNHNDLSMIEAAGLGVAMGNAEPELKAAARLVVGDNASDAIGETIERLIAGEVLA